MPKAFRNGKPALPEPRPVPRDPVPALGLEPQLSIALLRGAGGAGGDPELLCTLLRRWAGTPAPRSCLSSLAMQRDGNGSATVSRGGSLLPRIFRLFEAIFVT